MALKLSPKLCQGDFGAGNNGTLFANLQNFERTHSRSNCVRDCLKAQVNSSVFSCAGLVQLGLSRLPQPRGSWGALAPLLVGGWLIFVDAHDDPTVYGDGIECEREAFSVLG